MPAGWDNCGNCGRQIPMNAGGYCSASCRSQARTSGVKDPKPDVYKGWAGGGADRRGSGGGGGQPAKGKGCKIVLLEAGALAAGLAIVGRLALRKVFRS